jgi:excisionase family DNA binding protein
MSTDDKLLKPDEVAAFLGVPKATLYAWRYRREGPPAVRVGRHLRYRWSDLDRWLEDHCGHEANALGGSAQR